MKKFIPYIVFYILLFYLMPYLITMIPIVGGINKMATLILAILALVISGIIFGSKHRFSLFLPIIVAILFIPSALLHDYLIYRILFYGAIYFVATLIGNLTGLMFKRG